MTPNHQLSVIVRPEVPTTVRSPLAKVPNRTDPHEMSVLKALMEDVATVARPATLTDILVALEGEHPNFYSRKAFSNMFIANLRSKPLTDGVPPRAKPSSRMRKPVKLSPRPTKRRH